MRADGGGVGLRQKVGEGERALYVDMVDSARSRVLDPLELGYRRLRVERPLRLRLEVTAEGVARLGSEAVWLKFAEKNVEVATGLLRALGRLQGQVFMDRAKFRAALDAAALAERTALPTPARKAIEGALGETDEDAEICRDAKGNPEPDPSLRSQSEETAPLTETDLAAWFEREVRPHVPDAWLDTEKPEPTWLWRDPADDVKNPKRPGRVGYEVNFNRYFFKYEPPRALEEIDRELAVAEEALQAALHEVMGR